MDALLRSLRRVLHVLVPLGARRPPGVRSLVPRSHCSLAALFANYLAFVTEVFQKIDLPGYLQMLAASLNEIRLLLFHLSRPAKETSPLCNTFVDCLMQRPFVKVLRYTYLLGAA